MTAAEAMDVLSGEVRRAWPKVRRASELPHPRWWRTATGWLEFHCPRLGERMVRRFARLIVETAREAERTGKAPEAWTVPEETRAAFRRASEGEHGAWADAWARKAVLGNGGASEW